MNIIFNSPIKNSISVYLIIAILLLIYKPSQLFNEDGELIDFGTDIGNTLLSYPIILYINAILITFFFEYIHLKKY